MHVPPQVLSSGLRNPPWGQRHWKLPIVLTHLYWQIPGNLSHSFKSAYNNTAQIRPLSSLNWGLYEQRKIGTFHIVLQQSLNALTTITLNSFRVRFQLCLVTNRIADWTFRHEVQIVIFKLNLFGNIFLNQQLFKFFLQEMCIYVLIMLLWETGTENRIYAIEKKQLCFQTKPT